MSIEEYSPVQSCGSCTGSPVLGSPLSPARSVSFGEVDIIEFELCAGEKSCGVPESGGAALFLGDLVDRHLESLEEHEQARQKLLEQRAKILGIQIPRKTPIETRGQDGIFRPLTNEKERVAFVRKHSPSLSPAISTADGTELEEIRLSRSKIYCTCTPPEKKGVKALRGLLERHHIKIPSKIRSKKAGLLRLVYQKLGERCCYDETCGCFKNGVECHEGTSEGGCGCATYQSPLRHVGKDFCGNQFGRYVYSQPTLWFLSNGE